MMPEPRLTRRRAFAVLLFAFAVATTACLARRADPFEDDDSDLITLNVVNHHRLNVTIFNVAQGRRERLGEVTAVATATFRLHLRRLFGSEIELYADAIGSPEAVRSEIVHLSPGDTVEWTLETELNRSHLMVK